MSSPLPHSHHDAETLRIEHVLHSHGGVLTRERLRAFCSADCWRELSFEAALHDAVEAGRIKELTPELYAIVEDPDP